MSWAKNTIVKNIKENYKKVTFLIIFLLIVYLSRYFISGKSFEWQNISPISQPDFQWTLYSAFTYIIPGFVLYTLGFYWILYQIIVKLFGNYRLYTKIKKFVWVFLVYFTYTKIIPWMVNFLNQIISIFFNIVCFIIYLFPSLVIYLPILLFFIFRKNIFSFTRKHITYLNNI